MDLTVATVNHLHARSPWRNLADIQGHQEADKPAWWVKARKPGFKPTQPAALAVGITWDNGWKIVPGSATCERTHDGRKGVTPHRYVTSVVLEKDGQKVKVINTHAVRPDGVIPLKAWRRAMWVRHFSVLCRIVGEARMQGLPVVVTGDFNRTPAQVQIPGLACAWSSHHGGIDQIHYSPEFTVTGQHQAARAESDHPPLIVSMTLGQEAPVTDDRYELTTFGDGNPKTVDRMTRQALEKAERRLGYPLTIVQGSYHRGVSQSAGTHDGGGVVDLAPWDWENKVKALRQIGFAAWHRTPNQGPWGEHIHAVLIGDEKASPSALRQVESYKRGRNGLASNGVDDFWRPATIRPYRYKPPPPPSRVSIFRSTVEEALAVTLPKVDAIDRPAAYRMLKAVQAALDAGPKA